MSKVIYKTIKGKIKSKDGYIIALKYINPINLKESKLIKNGFCVSITPYNSYYYVTIINDIQYFINKRDVMLISKNNKKRKKSIKSISHNNAVNI
ncbi:hypothetical protein [Pseudochrobactrum asaccharolyticum]|uniref:hypothetical protein n=1 Tax=Pseudochrobactrum asaccharolyticum TaxID=354351 RepID=UPI004042A535